MSTSLATPHSYPSLIYSSIGDYLILYFHKGYRQKEILACLLENHNIALIGTIGTVR